MLLESVRRGGRRRLPAPRQRVCIPSIRYQPEADGSGHGATVSLPGCQARACHGEAPATGRSAARRHAGFATTSNSSGSPKCVAFELIGHLARDGITGRILDGPAVLRYVSSTAEPDSVQLGRAEALTATPGPVALR